jgi:signal transduction histidine kinase/CheY-like chemotaxis protein
MSFFLMVWTSYFFVSAIVRSHNLDNVEEAFSTAEARLEESLHEAEMTLANASFVIGEMAENGEPPERVRRYMTDLANWLQDKEHMLGFNGLYGVVRGDFLDGVKGDAAADDEVENQPWFAAAKKMSGQVATTLQDRSGTDRTIIFSQALYDDEMNFLGVLALDVYFTKFLEYAGSIGAANGGYGVILNQNLEIIAHKETELLGMPLQKLSEDWLKATTPLESVGEVFERQMVDFDGERAVAFLRQIFNGWYIGTIIPLKGFYRDVRDTTFVLSLLAAVMMSILSFILLRLNAAKMRLDENNKSKSSFLARMSHELRTPMNAIIGMSELALREEGSPAMTRYVESIKKAGYNLLSIINDILDFSKIESGNLPITPIPYRLASLLNDVVNVIQVRLFEKPIIFTVRADGRIRNNLVGDEVRVRQILINVLSNAVKYTHKGYIEFTIDSENIGGDEIRVTFKIADSGIGIKEEDLENLFVEFVKVDGERERAAGTGLGLAITRRLCRAMEGDVTVESTYGEGSIFTVELTQKFVGEERLAVVDSPEKKRVLFYDERALYAGSVLETLERLGVEVFRALEPKDFFAKLESDAFQFAFISPRILEQTENVVKNLHLKTRPVLLAELGEISSFQDISTLTMPAYAVSIANVLNGTTAADNEGADRFIAAEVRVLVVDDNLTNLKVTEGLLMPYQMQVDLCESGAEAIALVKVNPYDLIFMDHMMPGMDGLETTARLRSMKNCRNVPIVALTANAMPGMREMFLSKGMNDFLPKPVDPAMLDLILYKWIPKSKQTTLIKEDVTLLAAGEPILPCIDDVDVETALKRLGGNVDAYLNVIRSYVTHTPVVLAKLREPCSLREYEIAVHGIKGSSRSICANAVGDMAEDLETAARAGDSVAVWAKNDSFIRAVENVLASLSVLLDGVVQEKEKKLISAPDEALLSAVFEACENYDVNAMEHAVSKLEQYAYEDKAELVTWLRNRLEALEYDQIRERLGYELSA